MEAGLDEFIEDLILYIHRNHKYDKDAAFALGTSPVMLSNVLRRRKRPTKSMLSKLGYEKIVTVRYTRIPPPD